MKIALSTVSQTNSISTINSNFTKLATELQEKVLYRNNPTGEPNELANDIDMNGKNLYNAGVVQADYLTVDGQSISISEINAAVAKTAVDAIATDADRVAAENAAIAANESKNIAIQSALAAQIVTDGWQNVAGDFGYEVPVPYGADILITTPTQTVEYNGEIYAPYLSELPFTTSGTFESSKFRVIQTNTLAILAENTGAGLVGYVAPGLFAVDTTVESKLRERINVKDFGAVGDGIADDTIPFTVAAAEARTAGTVLVVPSGTYLLTSAISFTRQFETNVGVAFTGPKLPAGTPPPVLIHIARRLSVEGVTFRNLTVSAAANDTIQAVTPMRFERNNFVNAALVVGQTLQHTAGYLIVGNVFVSDLGRVCDGISLKNCANVTIRSNKFRGYLYGIKVQGTIGFSQSGYTIDDNTFERVNTGVGLLGSSSCRVSSINLFDNTITQDRRDTLVNSAAVELDWCHRLNIRSNNVSGPNTVLRIRSCVNVVLDDNRLDHTVGIVSNTNASIYMSGCHNVRVLRNRVSQAVAGGYSVIVGTSFTLLPAAPGGFYKSADMVFDSNDFRGVNRVMKLGATTGLRIVNNRFSASAALDATARMLYLEAGCTGFYNTNEYLGPSGTPVNNSSAGGVVTTNPAETLVVTPPPAAVVTAPVITVGDTALNNSKSYVVTFTMNNVTALTQLVDETAPQRLSTWMAAPAAAGAVLGWNSAPYNSGGDDLVKDLVANGGLHSRSGAEEYVGSRSALVIDRLGYLTCRDFHVPVTTTGAPVLAPTTAIEEGAWQTVSFRPPLVIDGAVYDPRTTGLLGDTVLDAGSYFILDATTGLQIPFAGGTIDIWSQRISGRTCIGQKADGTFVLLIVDGRTNTTGCSKKQAATKLAALGCVNAYNLDGGGSTTLWYNGSVINSPSDASGQRVIPAVMYV